MVCLWCCNRYRQTIDLADVLAALPAQAGPVDSTIVRLQPVNLAISSNVRFRCPCIDRPVLMKMDIEGMCMLLAPCFLPACTTAPASPRHTCAFARVHAPHDPGSEWVVLPHLLRKGLLCRRRVHTLVVEFHEPLRAELTPRSELTRDRDGLLAAIAAQDCAQDTPTEVAALDDETFLRDGECLPGELARDGACECDGYRLLNPPEEARRYSSFADGVTSVSAADASEGGRGRHSGGGGGGVSSMLDSSMLVRVPFAGSTLFLVHAPPPVRLHVIRCLRVRSPRNPYGDRDGYRTRRLEAAHGSW